MSAPPLSVRVKFFIGFWIGVLFGPIILLLPGEKHLAFGYAHMDQSGHWTGAIIKRMP